PHPFLFYPTANRPNKELSFLLHVFEQLRRDQPELRLALTCSLSDYAPVEETARALGLLFEGDTVERSIMIFAGAHEGVIRWLYENAEGLCFTSTMEGNFPPQIIEALHYDTPVVSTRLPLITQVLGEYADNLLLCPPKHLPDFIFQTKQLLRNRQLIVERQSRAKRRVLLWNNSEKFNSGISSLFREAAGENVQPVEKVVCVYNDRFLPFGLMARIKLLLSRPTSDHEFSLHLHDLVLRKVANECRSASMSALYDRA
ncbi:MAG: glycosyltransferase, partial [Bryobacteraceae bacterium]